LRSSTANSDEEGKDTPVILRNFGFGLVWAVYQGGREGLDCTANDQDLQLGWVTQWRFNSCNHHYCNMFHQPRQRAHLVQSFAPRSCWDLLVVWLALAIPVPMLNAACPLSATGNREACSNTAQHTISSPKSHPFVFVPALLNSMQGAFSRHTSIHAWLSGRKYDLPSEKKQEKREDVYS
jgi:hypothetical protein